MARNRVILFGYCMKNGEITTEPKEVYAVEEIFREYLNGSSFLQIAKLMESEKSGTARIPTVGTKIWSSG